MLKTTATRARSVRHEIGVALRARRKELRLTMQAVADAAHLSVGFISQVERGLTAPSVASLVNLGDVLDMDMGAVLQSPNASGQTTHGGTRTPYSVADAAVSYERLSTNFPGSTLHSLIIHEPPGHRTEPISHRGEEMFFVLAGAITAEVEGRADILREGDSIHFDSTRVHSTWNHTTATVSFLWCGTMDVFGDAPPPIHKPDERPEEGEASPQARGETDR